MANRPLLLCLVLSILLACFYESVVASPKRSGGGWSRSSSSSRGSYSKPSSSSSSWSSRSKPSYPSSGGLSGYGSGSSSHSYPQSNSGLSGNSGSSWSSWNSKPSYPSSGGLSGYGTGSSSHGYPQSSSGLSGSGKQNPSYPASNTGLSGSGSSSSSGSGWSWWGSGSSSSNNNYGNNKYSNSYGGSSGSNSYNSPLPAGVEYVHQQNLAKNNAKPSYTNNNNKYSNNYGTPHHTGTNAGNVHVTNVFHSTPYYTSPQYVYVNEYRNSGSRYGDILTGLALYNMGRSHSHYHNDYYYHDNYYRRQYNSGSSANGNYDSSSQNSAICTMKITENGRVETLLVPCAIVSTFTNVGTKVSTPQNQVNTTTCVTNSTMVNSTIPVNATSVNSTVSSNVTMVNSTSCTFSVAATDPLLVKGPALDPSGMQCEVEIRTRELITTNKVDCSTLMRYSKMPEPKNNNLILPDREKLKKMLQKPPWWMSLFIAV